jgi:ABC-2 type transport system permease protein
VNRRRAGAIARQELRLFRRDPTFLVITTVMPLIVIPVLKSTVEDSLQLQGFTDATGAEQVVPGQAVIFSFFLVGSVGFSFFREHGWNTWDRLRASPARSSEIMVGKLVPWVGLGMAQITLVLAFGWVFYGIDLGHKPAGMALVTLSYVTTLVTLAVALTAVLSKVQQINAIANLGAILLGAIGGAFVVVNQLPGWVQSVAPSTPTYWIMRGYRSMLLEEASVGALWLPFAVLSLFTIAFASLAAFRFRFDETKLSWA